MLKQGPLLRSADQIVDAAEILPVFERIQRCPTAPFHEYHVRDEILQLLGEIPSVSVTADDFGNLIATYQRGDQPGRLAFGAHMDHPAYVRSPESGEMEFLGGVPERYRDKNPPRNSISPDSGERT